MDIHIVLPYDNAEKNLYIWANEEKKIDFRKDKERAQRCTVCFAATELVSYLKKLGAAVTFSDKAEKEFNIALLCSGCDETDDSYIIEPLENGVNISSHSRTGVLYGAYELLKLQGIRWLSPWCDIVPEMKINEIELPDKKTEYTFDMSLGRGFDFEGELKESTKLWLWMARNGLNLSACRPYTAAFQKKLGMSFKMGGHIFERMLAPDRVIENGKTLWEAHNDWYGVDLNQPRTKENAQKTQFCMSNNDLLKFLSEELLDCINNEWYEADRIDVWTFDTWGSGCQCENCRKLGNNTDRTLHFLSYLRSCIDKARDENRLDHDISIVMCSYEGTDTLLPPENPVPENLTGGKDYITYYPILRCYQHTFSDEKCPVNAHYKECLEGWEGIPVMLGEYYNVTKHEDLPLLFTKTMQKDFQYYKKTGVKGMTYMHLPMIEWGMRNLTQVLYANLCRDADTDINKLCRQYFTDRYNNQSEK